MATAAEKLGSVKKWDHWIGGKATPSESGQYLDDLNPEDDSVFAQFAAGTAGDIDKAAQVAQETFQSYSKSLASEREAILSKTAELMEQNRQDFVDQDIDEFLPVLLH